MFTLIALIVSIVGSIPILFVKLHKDSKFPLFLGAFAFYFVLSLWSFWGGLPSMAYPLLGWVGGIIVVWWVFSIVIITLIFDKGSLSFCIVPVIFGIVGVFIIVVVAMSGWPMFGNSGDYSKLIGTFKQKTEKSWNQDIQVLDPSHIRLVPKELAIKQARMALSQDGITLGSQFRICEDYTTLQTINGEYWYIVPIDFKGYKVWSRTDYVPGYIKVNAVDPYAKPILIDDRKMKYTPNAYFGDNLKRRLYKDGWYNKILTEYSLEETDDGRVLWVITVCVPTISYWGQIVEGVIMYDSETGDYVYRTVEEINTDEKYNWLDRVFPDEFVETYVDAWGKFKDGWWNGVWTHLNVLQAEKATLNYSVDGSCVFVAPVTSTNVEDQAMTGLMYCDARTGEFTYYGTSGGATQSAVIEAVNNVVGYKNWHASEQIVYENLYGKLVAIVPVIGQNGTYQSLAIVDNTNKRVFLGVKSSEALIDFMSEMNNSSGQLSIDNSTGSEEYIGVLSRIGWDLSNGNKQFYLYFVGINNSFVVSSNIKSELPLTQIGDSIQILYINSGEYTVPTISFKNLSLSIIDTETQKNVDIQIIKRDSIEQKERDISSFKGSIKNMSDDEVE